MKGLGKNILLALVGIVLALGFAEFIGRVIEGRFKSYPMVVYQTEIPGTEVWNYDTYFNGIADYDLRENNPFKSLKTVGNIDGDPSLAELSPLAVPMAIQVVRSDEFLRERGLTFLKPADSVNVVIGDSFCFGQGVRVQDRFSNLLETMLIEGKSTESYSPKVINVCQTGVDTEWVTQIYQGYVDRFSNMERLIYSFTLNDPFLDQALKDKEKHINDFFHFRGNNFEKEYGAFNTERSALVRFFLRRQVSNRVAEDTADWYRALFNDSEGWRRTQEEISKINKYVISKGKRFTFLVFPIFYQLQNYPLEGVHKKIAEFAARENIELIDLLPVFRGEDEKKYWTHPKDFHPNYLAHEKAAEELFKSYK